MAETLELIARGLREGAKAMANMPPLEDKKWPETWMEAAAAGLSIRAYNRLCDMREQPITLSELRSMSLKTMRQWRGVGVTTAHEIKTWVMGTNDQ